MSNLLEFRHLKYIVALAEAGNFTRAAEQLFLSQPSLRKQIKDIEDEIGFSNFIRTREGMRVTPSGQMMVAYAQDMLAGRTEIITMVRAVHRGNIPPLRLGFSAFIDPKLVQSFVNHTSRCSLIVLFIYREELQLVSFRDFNKDLSKAQYFPCQLKAHKGCFSKYGVIHLSSA
jgi:hypothetical protein